ncbi:MAG: transglycosylase SLT domain-containing protein [Polyangiaceae bacterium]|nr:transglycosylase SLT domain-containing protein [Polyangiaceae bacterium]
MSLVEKIPPLVSALAFGYGVGMAAPEVSLDSIRGGQDEAAKPRVVMVDNAHRPAPVLSASLEARLPGEEASALRELRATRAPSRYGELTSREVFGRDLRPRNEYASVYDEDMMAEADELESVGSAAISRLQLPDFGLGVSRQTLKYVRFFTKTDRGRNMFETWLKRSGRYQEMVQEELRARDLPEDLIWVAMIESGFDATAKSPVGAVGLWQFMPATGAVYGLRQNKFVDQRRNPKLATQAAAHHLRDLYMRFGQWDLALAAYNMGYEQLLDRIDRVGTTDFNELVRAGVMPEETSKYVPKILAAAIVANNLERFDFNEVEVSKSIDVAELAVPPRTPLETIAKAAGVSTSTIRKFNPDVLGKELPPGKGDFLVNVPSDSIQRAVAMLPTMLDLSRSRSDEVDVLDPIDLMSPEGYRPQAEEDQSLLSYLPKPKKKRRSMRDPLEERLEERLGEIAEADEREEEKDKKGKDTVLYRAGSGDTITEIAKQFDVDASDVARDNGLKAGDKVKEGTLVKLRVKRSLLDSKPAKTGDLEEDERPSGRSGKNGKRPVKG